MNLELTIEQAQDLKSLLDRSLKEMSHEIAGTDNARYRAELSARRHRLVEVNELITGCLGASTPSGGIPRTPATIIQELAHPGD